MTGDDSYHASSPTLHSPDSSTFPNPHSQVIVNDATHILSSYGFANTSFRSTDSAADASFDTISTSVPPGNRHTGVSASSSSWRSQSPATIKAELVVEDRRATPQATDPNRDCLRLIHFPYHQRWFLRLVLTGVISAINQFSSMPCKFAAVCMTINPSSSITRYFHVYLWPRCSVTFLHSRKANGSLPP